MNEPNIDILLQLTAPRPEWKAPSVPGDRQLPPDFSEQLWQLTAPPPPPPGRSVLPRHPIDPHPREDAVDSRPAPRAVADEQSSHVQSNRDTTSTSSTASPGEAQAGANPSQPAVSEQQESPVDDDSDNEDRTEHAEIADESGAADVAGGLPQAPVNDAAPVDNASGESDEIVSKAILEAAENVNKTALAATANSVELDPPAMPPPATVEAAAEPTAIAQSPSQSNDHSQTPQQAASSSADLDLTAADAQLIEVNAKATVEVAGAPAERGEGDAPQATRGKRPAKSTRNAKMSDPAPPVLAAANGPSAEIQSIGATSATHVNNESRELEAHDGPRDAPIDERPRARGKESTARSAQRTGPAPAVSNISGAASQNDPLKSGEATAATSDDTASQPVRPAAGRADGVLTTLARGPRGGRLAPAAELKDDGTLNRVDTARFVGRVTRAFHYAQERGGTLQLRLSPPELGSLRLELTVKEGALTASLEAETPAARRLLLDHLPALRERLAEQNVRVERFDVDVRRDGRDGRDGQNTQGGQADSFLQQQAQQERRAQHTATTRQRPQKTAARVDANVAERAKPIVANSTGINLVV